MELLIKFTDQSPSYTYGVEFGRILAKMESGVQVVGNSGFPVRMENKLALVDACAAYGYLPLFRECHGNEWVEFTATKKEITN